jgi:uncharacterized lipoprotein YmbA
MRLALPSLAALCLAACSGGGPTAAEENLPETARAPELTANSAATVDGNASITGGPVSDRGSGTGGDTGN